MLHEIVGDSFLIKLRGKEYRCQAYKANERMLYQININGRPLYVTRALNQHRIPFWTTVPQDFKFRTFAYEIGNQIEKHFN
jgi:hypothetical protein